MDKDGVNMINEQRNMKQPSIDVIQNIILENRNKLSITGVKDVFSFDDQIVILETELGMLTIKGTDIRINKLSIDTTDVIIEGGEINSINYDDKTEKRNSGSILSKLFK